MYIIYLIISSKTNGFTSFSSHGCQPPKESATTRSKAIPCCQHSSSAPELPVGRVQGMTGLVSRPHHVSILWLATSLTTCIFCSLWFWFRGFYVKRLPWEPDPSSWRPTCWPLYSFSETESRLQFFQPSPHFINCFVLFVLFTTTGYDPKALLQIV